MHPVLRRLALPPARLAVAAFTRVSDNVRSPDGHVYRVNRSIHPFDYIGLRRGLYEHDEREMIGSVFQPDDTILDIGANIGVVATAAFENKLKDGGRMICVEPNPDSLAALKTNMDRAHARYLSRNYDILNVAITAGMCASAEFRQRANLSSGLSSAVKPHANDRVISVPAMSLTDLVEKYAAKGASLICDAEGAEIDWIDGEKAAFEPIRQIAIELHEPKLTGRIGVTPERLAGEIEKMGFICGARAGNTFYFSRPGI